MSVASAATPDWDVVRANANLAPTDEAMRDDMRAWAAAVRRLVKCMQALHVKLDMEDRRKCI